MELIIHNFAKIESAEISLNGITLIAGANDTGKSTCGKALCTLLMALEQLESSSKYVRRNKIRDAIGSFMDDSYGTRHFVFVEEERIDEYLAGGVPAEKFAHMVLQTLPRFPDKRKTLSISSLVKKLEEVRLLDEEEVRCSGLRRSFSSVFHDQYMPLFKVGANGGTKRNSEILFKYGNAKLSSTLTKTSAKYLEEQKFTHRAWYVNNPSVVDEIGIGFARRGNDCFEYTILKALSKSLIEQKVNPVEGAFDDVLLKKKLDIIDSQFRRMNDDEVVFSRSKGLQIKRNGLREGLLLSNASMGIKSLALIRLMINNLVITTGDILVLDEPEIHLHPEWQMIYAELIVLMWKELGIFVMLTTHSPDFIQAIRLFSKKHGVLDCVSAYLSVGSNAIKFEQLKNKDWDKLFDRFMPTVKMLEQLANEVDC